MSIERRRWPRLEAPVIYRQAGATLFHHPRSAVDVSTGGMRALSDDALQVGDRLELDLLPASGDPIRLWAMVVWMETLPPGADALYEIGLLFQDVLDADRQRLAAMLVRVGDPGGRRDLDSS